MKIRNDVKGRREFISMLSAAAAIGFIGATGIKEESLEYRKDENLQQVPVLPEISLGKHRISRLICGSNPMLGYSYLGSHTDRQMREYFTTERTVGFLQSCEQAGITAHQMSGRFDYLAPLRERGSKLRLICLHEQREKILDDIKIAQPIAMVHHGGVTDRLFAGGKSETVKDYVKAVRDTGVLAGVSAHNPDVIKQIADEGWDVDFFMTCFYFLTRNHGKGEPQSILPAGGYNFYRNDPANMTSVIRQVKQPCLAFKILGAGRLCSNQETVKSAFQFAFENIKPIDGIIVGMFPWSFNEITANSNYTRELGI